MRKVLFTAIYFGAVALFASQIIAVHGQDESTRICLDMTRNHVAVDFVDDLDLYVLDPSKDTSDWIQTLELVRISLADGKATSIGELKPRLPIRSGTLFKAGPRFYFVGQYWPYPHSSVWVKNGSGDFDSLASYLNHPRTGDFWSQTNAGALMRISYRHVNPFDSTWTVQIFQPNVAVREDSYQIEPDSEFVARWSNQAPATMVVLENGNWLCMSRSDGLSVWEPPAEIRSWDWFFYWVIDPKAGRMVRHGTHRLEDISHGSVSGWLAGYPAIEPLASDAAGVSALVEGGRADGIPGSHKSDYSQCRLHLLRFTSDGELIIPSEGTALAVLTAKNEVGTPLKRILGPMGHEFGGEKGDFRIIEIGTDYRITFRDFRDGVEKPR